MPNKSSDPELTILAVSATILKILKKKKVALYSEIYHEIGKQNDKATYLFNMALELLFLMALIEYYPKNDLLEYIGK
ncbi:ABC-three component system middle component 8 [Serratia liquefaciens]|uniref:ABC-three component system middle component 8 n=1 Tax=Serratia liquefaciens TaxID=614 RepID=UPI0021C864B3|nr:ABC-three component system middle component 8 [Serratia liquefaciens]